MSLKTECQPNVKSLKTECASKWNVPQNGMLLKMEFQSRWNVIKNGMSLIPPQFSSLRLKHQPVTQNGISL